MRMGIWVIEQTSRGKTIEERERESRAAKHRCSRVNGEISWGGPRGKDSENHIFGDTKE